MKTWMWIALGAGVIYLLTRKPTTVTQTTASTVPGPFGPATATASAGR